MELKDEKSNIEVWKLQYNHLTQKPSDHEWTSYSQYIKDLFPIKTEAEEPDISTRKKHNYGQQKK